MSETNNLKEYIHKLIEIEKEEEKYKTLFSNLKKEKDTLNNLIINFMESNKITDKDIIFGEKKIKYTKTKIELPKKTAYCCYLIIMIKII